MSVRNVVRVSAAVVSVSTFVLLYFGLVDLARLSGMDDLRAWLYPLAIDGMVAAGYAATLVLSGNHLRFAWFVVIVGSTLSLIGQWLHAARLSEWTWAGPVAAAPAVSMALVWHLLFLVLKSGQSRTVEAVANAVAEAVATEPTVRTIAEVPAPAPAPLSVVSAAAVTPVKAVRVSAPVRPSAEASERLTRAVAALSAAMAKGETMTGPRMAEALGLDNAGTPAGARSGQRWMRKAEAALS